MSRISNLLLLMSLFWCFRTVFTISSDDACLIFNEINVDGPTTTTLAESPEFIELKNICGSDGSTVTLDDYTLAIWKGSKKSSKSTLQRVFPLRGNAFRRGSSLFLIAAPKIVANLSMNNSAVDFDTVYGREVMDAIKKDPSMRYLDNGKRGAIALVIYKNPVTLNEGSELTEVTAEKDRIVDILIYHEKGNGEAFVNMFFADYSLPEIDGVMGIELKDAGKYANEDVSLSYCCEKDRPKWPLGFRKARPTPGERNDCKGAPFALTSVGSEITDSNRCQPEILRQLENQQKSAPRNPSSLAAIQLAMSTKKEKINDNSHKTTLLVSALFGVGGTVLLFIVVCSYIYCKNRKRAAQRFRPTIVRYNGLEEEEEDAQ